jgi:hypothetical protein
MAGGRRRSGWLPAATMTLSCVTAPLSCVTAPTSGVTGVTGMCAGDPRCAAHPAKYGKRTAVVTGNAVKAAAEPHPVAARPRSGRPVRQRRMMHARY